jgi:peptidyl-prolyl cis-trans isomerase B (cyclophilin B)
MNKIVIGLIAVIVIYIVITKYNDNKSVPKVEQSIVPDVINQDDSEDDNEENDEDINTEDADSFFNMTETEHLDENDENNNLVYLDISTNGHRGRIIINLKSSVVPQTCNNFMTLCNKKAYKNTKFHRVIKDFMVQGGDFTNNDGTGGVSIYGNTFPDENFKLKNKKGTIAMANSGPDANGSQFFINTIDTPWLNKKHVVFGNVVKGMDLIEWISNQETNDNDVPVTDVTIEDCGSL